MQNPEITFAQSDSIAHVATALTAIQDLSLNVEENQNNPTLKNDYADLKDVLRVIRPVLAKYKLALAQFPGLYVTSDGVGKATLVNLITHESGEWIRAEMEVPAPPPNRGTNSAQCWGSAITYGRRYAILAIFCMSTGEPDDDANQAVTEEERQQRSGPAVNHTKDADTVPWQKLINGAWQAVEVPGEGVMFGELPRERLRELWILALNAEKIGDKPNQKVVASFYDDLIEITSLRRLAEEETFEQTLTRASAEWPAGQTDPLKMRMSWLKLAYAAIHKLPAQS